MRSATSGLSISVFVVSLFAAGCDGGQLGDRCNPLLSHDECNSGLTCQQPNGCAENYCCPTPATESDNPYCNGSACDAGVADATSDAGSDAVTSD